MGEGQAVEARSEGAGIDLFDFLYEVWVARWPVVGIVLGFLLLGLLSLVPQMLAPSGPQPVPVAQSQILFSVNSLDDPIGRDPAKIIADFLRRVADDSELGLSNVDGAAIGIPPSDRTYRMSFNPASNTGVFTITAPGAEAGYFDRVFGTFQKLCVQQGADLKLRQQANLAIIEEILRDGVTQRLEDRLWDRAFLARRYLGLPDVQAGTLCLLPMSQRDVRVLPAAGGRRALVKRVVIAGLVGGVIAIFFVMFRIAIARRRGVVAAG